MFALRHTPETAACITDSLGATVIYMKHSELKHSKTN